MLSVTLTKFQQLRPPVRSLVFLFWVYAFTGSVLGIFTQIFLFQQFQNVTLNIYASMCLFTGIMVGFVVAGVIAGHIKLNIKHGFLFSFIVTGGAIVLLLYSSIIEIAYTAMFLYGVGQGLFWLTIHTFELSETTNQERDFYSSLLSAGGQMFGLIGPAVATLLIWLSESLLHWETFTLLFIVTPVFYLSGFLCFSNISDYYPDRIVWADIKHFFTEKRNLVAQLYLFGDSIAVIAQDTIIPMAILFILGGILEVGVYNTILAIFSAFFVLALSHYRTTSNRLFIFGLASIAAAVITVMFGWFFGFLALVIYTIFMGVLNPILRVSRHIIDLETMESVGRENTDFYPTMIMRDFSLFVWRMVGGAIILLLLEVFHKEDQLFVVGFNFIATSFILALFGAYMLLKLQPKDQSK